MKTIYVKKIYLIYDCINLFSKGTLVWQQKKTEVFLTYSQFSF
jgi:hypothetical protein